MSTNETTTANARTDTTEHGPATELRVDPPHAADERTMMDSWLDFHRATVRLKCAGLDQAHAVAAPLPSSPMMSIGGIVSHLRWVEHAWFVARLLGSPDEVPYNADDLDADWRIGAQRPLGELLDEYDAQCARSREIAAKLEFGSAARRARQGEPPVTLRWVMAHMVEETARHNGHLDILREMADGVVGE